MISSTFAHMAFWRGGRKTNSKIINRGEFFFKFTTQGALTKANASVFDFNRLDNRSTDCNKTFTG